MTTELFSNLPDDVKMQAKSIVDLALLQDSARSAAKIISDYIDTCKDEEEAEFVEFYFKTRLMQ